MISLEIMKVDILAAVQDGYSKRKLDKGGKGKAVNRLLAGKGVTVKKIEEMWAALPDTAKTDQKLNTATIATVALIESQMKGEKEAPGLAQIRESLLDMQGQIADVLARVGLLEAVSSVKESVQQPIRGLRGERVLGFTLYKDKKDRYSAIKWIAGKNYSVYVGRDKDMAVEKIRAWLANHPEIQDKYRLELTPEKFIQ